jgi:hypothetical protein
MRIRMSTTFPIRKVIFYLACAIVMCTEPVLLCLKTFSKFLSILRVLDILETKDSRNSFPKTRPNQFSNIRNFREVTKFNGIKEIYRSVIQIPITRSKRCLVHLLTT